MCRPYFRRRVAVLPKFGRGASEKLRRVADIPGFAHFVVNGTYVVKCLSALSVTILGKIRLIRKGPLTSRAGGGPLGHTTDTFGWWGHEAFGGDGAAPQHQIPGFSWVPPVSSPG